jgi:hypothetical protein
MKKLMPVVIALAGVLGGTGAGFFLRPAADAGKAAEAKDHGAEAGPVAEGGHGAEDGHDEAAPDGHDAALEKAAPADGHAGEAADEAHADDHGETSNVPDYVKLSNQFVVPVVEGGRVAAMVILSLTLEVPPGASEGIYAREPKLRDAFLQVLFDHANAGGFRGAFTDGANLILLRRALLEVGQKVSDGVVKDVLIADIVRQDN